ncbi:MAG TPA: LacI family DNA-binding transcriptional regulator [Microlunatus sp.]|nr:LacI family DNA-binding transcriptional regulator [Microlunatus sp.]
MSDDATTGGGPVPARTTRPRARKSTTAGRATIYSVAERAGVSIATVSRVLSGTTVTSAEAAEKVLKAARELAYVPQNSAKSLASSRYQTHAVVIGSLDGPYYSELLMGYEEVAAKYDQELLLVVADQQRRNRTLGDLRARVDGVVIAQMDTSAEEVAALARLIPVVLVGRTQIDGCDSVVSESAETAVFLTRHLIEAHARRRLVFIGDPARSSDVSARHQGFRAALRAGGLEPAYEPLAVPYTERGGERATDLVLALPERPDALVCANDEVALALAAGLRREGVGIGGEVAITGWDDVTAARFVTPGLTTARQPVREMGGHAAELLHGRVRGLSGPAVQHVLPTEVVIRQSCGCPD